MDMHAITEYMKSTYDRTALAFLSVLGLILIVGFFVTLVLAVCFSIKKFTRKKLALDAEVSETYLLLSQVLDELKELGDIDEEKAKRLYGQKKEYEEKLKELLKTDDAVKKAGKLAESNLRRKKREIENGKRNDKPAQKPVYHSPEANFLDEETINEVMTIFARLDAENPELRQSDEITEYSSKWVINSENGNFVAELKVNEVTLLSSSAYKSLSGVKSAITTIKNNIKEKNFSETVTENGEYIFKVFSASGRIIGKGKPKELSFDCKKDISLAEKYFDADISE